MKHFSEEAWADFARNLAVPDLRMAMQQHIGNGCAQCQMALQVWQSVVSMAKAENGFIPPNDVVRVTKSQFAATGSEANHGLRLLFDSNLEPVAAGVRGSISPRQFLYETDDYYIDLRLEPRRDTDRACVVGQVLNRVAADRKVQGVTVRLQTGKMSIAQTVTNQFGEFQLEFEASSDLCLSVGHEENEIILPLYGVQNKSRDRKDLG